MIPDQLELNEPGEFYHLVAEDESGQRYIKVAENPFIASLVSVHVRPLPDGSSVSVVNIRYNCDLMNLRVVSGRAFGAEGNVLSYYSSEQWYSPDPEGLDGISLVRLCDGSYVLGEERRFEL